MRPLVGLFGLLIAANAAAWLWALATFADQPVLLGTALLAWSLGLRHAVDADHIAAIDNATRKLMQPGRGPLTVGLFFALGHSTVVTLAVAGLAAAAPVLGDRLELVGRIGETVGTLVSVLFLLAIAAANLLALRASRRDRRAADLDGGPLARLCRPLFRLVGQPWHMFLLGALFGLGFDTATEVALLALTAAQAAHATSVSAILVFPALFAAAMALVDTADGAIMARAYGWALVEPFRRSAYNLVITLVSVTVAVAVAGLQLFGWVSERWGRPSAFWDTIGWLNDNADGLGLAIVGVFVAIWIGAVLHRTTREKRGEAAAD